MNEGIIIAFIGILGIALGAAFQKSTADKNNRIDNITKERKGWRDKIRELTRELNEKDADYRVVKVEFQTRLNPYKEDDDEKIIKLFDDLIREEDLIREYESSKLCRKRKIYLLNKSNIKKTGLLNELNIQIAYLLKYD